MVYNLTSEQQKAMDEVKKGKSIFITGPGGCGKTYLINAIKDWAQNNSIRCATTALTGCASVLIDGITLHSWGGLGQGKLSSKKLINILTHDIAMGKQLANWRNTAILVIDEISMMSAELFNKVMSISTSNEIRPIDSSPPLQFIFSGDFAQLPPIDKLTIPRFCFESSKWKNLITKKNTFYFKTIIRQKDKNFADILSRVRLGKLTQEDKKILSERIVPSDKDVPLLKGIKPTLLYPHKEKVNSINRKELKKLDSPTKILFATYFSYNPVTKITSQLPISSIYKSQINKMDSLNKGQHKIKLCIGAQVMLTVNLDFERNLINGSRGVVVDFDDTTGDPIVDFGPESTPEPIIIDKFSWNMETKYSSTTIIRKQYPLILAWSLTCHKAQGATLTYVVTDLSKVFTPGQSYVTLSRVQTIDGLFLTGIKFSKIRCHPKVRRFYKSLEE